MKRLILVLVSLFVATGCDQSQKFNAIDDDLKKLQSKITEFDTLKSSIEKIEKDYLAVEEQREKQAALETRLALVVENTSRLLTDIKSSEANHSESIEKVNAFATTLKSSWEDFKLAYDPKLREQVQANAESAKNLTGSIVELEETSKNRLVALAKLVEEATSLKQECEKNAEATKKLDAFASLSASVGELKGSYRATVSRLDGMDKDIRTSRSKSDELDGKVKAIDSTAKSAEQKAKSAEQKAQSAELKAKSAEQKAQSAETLARSK